MPPVGSGGGLGRGRVRRRNSARNQRSARRNAPWRDQEGVCAHGARAAVRRRNAANAFMRGHGLCGDGLVGWRSMALMLHHYPLRLHRSGLRGSGVMRRRHGRKGDAGDKQGEQVAHFGGVVIGRRSGTPVVIGLTIPDTRRSASRRPAWRRGSFPRAPRWKRADRSMASARFPTRTACVRAWRPRRR